MAQQTITYLYKGEASIEIGLASPSRQKNYSWADLRRKVAQDFLYYEGFDPLTGYPAKEASEEEVILAANAATIWKCEVSIKNHVHLAVPYLAIVRIVYDEAGISKGIDIKYIHPKGYKAPYKGEPKESYKGKRLVITDHASYPGGHWEWVKSYPKEAEEGVLVGHYDTLFGVLVSNKGDAFIEDVDKFYIKT